MKISASTSSISTVMMGTLAVNMFLYPILSLTIKFLWNLFMALQIIVNLNLLNLVYPIQMTILFENLVNIANFKIIPTDTIVSAYKRWISENFVNDTNSNGYSDSSLILNLSTYIIFIIAALIILALSSLIIRLGRRVQW